MDRRQAQCGIAPNHDPVVAGSDLDAAVNAIEELEETAKLRLLLRAMTRHLTPAQVTELDARQGHCGRRRDDPDSAAMLRRRTADDALERLGRSVRPSMPPTTRYREIPVFRCGMLAARAPGELLSTDDIAGWVIAAKGFDAGDAILRASIREQVGSTVKRLPRNGAIENVGAGRASKWKVASA